jgi:citrate lyase subunit beta / citryl-CoA lyase
VQATAWVRINLAGTADAEDDLDAIQGITAGVRLPKTASVDDARWLVERVRGIPVICSIESKQGLTAAAAIASVAGVETLSLGSRDLTVDLGCEDGWDQLMFARRRLVLACRAAGIRAPVDSVYYAAADPDGRRKAAEAARQLGFSGKSTLWPEQVAAINRAFTTTQA